MSLRLCELWPALFARYQLYKIALSLYERGMSEGKQASLKREEMKIVVPQSTEGPILLLMLQIRPSVPVVLQKCDLLGSALFVT